MGRSVIAANQNVPATTFPSKKLKRRPTPYRVVFKKKKRPRTTNQKYTGKMDKWSDFGKDELGGKLFGTLERSPIHNAPLFAAQRVICSFQMTESIGNMYF